jgi:hypothetical protein
MKKTLSIVCTIMLMAFAMSGYADSHGQAQHGKEKADLDARIDSWVQEVCGTDAACAEQKRAHYQQRMQQYEQRVQKTCGDDQACRQDMRAKYMERRAKREARIKQHCGDDKACRIKLREEYRMTMDKAREQCKDDKACWKKFYDEKRPGAAQ